MSQIKNVATKLKPPVKSKKMTQTHFKVSKVMRAQPVQAQTPKTSIEPFNSLFQPNYLMVVIDTETSSLITNGDFRLLQIALKVDNLIANITAPNNKYMDNPPTFSSFVNPGNDFKVSEDTTRFTGITDNDIKDVDDTKTVLTKLNAFLTQLPKLYNLPSTTRIMLVAHSNFTFDQIVLQAEYLRYGLQLPENVRFIDTYYTIKTHFRRDWSSGQCSLQNIYRKIMKQPNWIQSHQADGDVDALLTILHNWPDRQDMYDLLYQDMRGPYTQTELNKIIKDIKAQANKYNNNNNNSNNNY